MSSILTVCPDRVDAGLISRAAALSEGRPVQALVRENDIEEASVHGASVIHVLEEYADIADDAALAGWLAGKIFSWGCDVILAPSTIRMRAVMSVLAAKLEAGLTADCVELSMDGENIVQVRPAFGNCCMATVKTKSRIQMATVRPGIFLPEIKRDHCPKIVRERFTGTQKIRLAARKSVPGSGTLRNAEIIIAGGAGIGSKDGFRKLEEIARLTGGAVGASRMAVDRGYAPYRYQIGLTGESVAPKVYLAFGISGAVQHLSGISGSDTVIAVNKDPNAPIFNAADFGIVGEWEEVADLLIKQLKEEKNELSEKI